MMNWRFCIDSPQKRALELCSKFSHDEGDGYSDNESDGMREGPVPWACGDGDGAGDTRYTWGNNGNGWSADEW